MGPELVGGIKFGTALFATVVLAVDAWLRRRGDRPAPTRWRDAALLAVGIAGALGWWNFLQFRYQPGFGHSHDIFHYYVGSKYFDELGYTRLYECTTVADVEAGFGEAAAARTIRNLRTYRRVSTAEIIAHPERCKRHFTPARWATFTHDIAFFRARFPAGSWQGLLADHGYNPSPAWGALASLFVRDGPVSEASLAPLLLIDPLLLVALWAVLWRAFGWRATCVALVFWGANGATDYLWTGGAFLRHGWLAALFIGVGCLRLGWNATAGFALTVAALLRVFPGAALAAIALQAGVAMAARRSLRPPPELRRLAAGCGLALVTLLPLSFATHGGPAAWVDFAHNIRFHAATPIDSHLGLESFLRHASPPVREGDDAGSIAGPDAARAEGIRGGTRAVVALGYIALLTRAVRRRPTWEAAILGTGAVLIFTTMANYYFALLLGFGLLWPRARAVGVALCALAAWTWCASWIWPRMGDAHAWISLAAVAFVLAVTTAYAFAVPRAADAT